MGSGSWTRGENLFEKCLYNPFWVPDDPLSRDLSFVGESQHVHIALALLKSRPYHLSLM